MVTLIRKLLHKVLTFAIRRDEKEYLITLVFSNDRMISDSISLLGVELDRNSEAELREDLMNQLKPFVEKEITFS